MDKIQLAALDIKNKLKKALESRGISQVELAKRIGCDKTSISHYIKGTRIPGLDTAVAICNELNISLDYLLSDQSQIFNIKDESIPTNDKDILLAISILMKRKIIQLNDYSGEIWIDSNNKQIRDFIYEVNRYLDSKYVKVDSVILSLIDGTLEELRKQYLNNNETNNELPLNFDNDERLPF